MQQAILEEVHSDVSSSIKAFTYDGIHFDTPYHFHPEYELTYIKSSSGLRYVGNTIQDYQAGELVLLGANLPHCWKSQTESTDRSTSLVIQWRRELLSNQPELKTIKTHLAKSAWGIRYTPVTSAEAVKAMEEIINSSPLKAFLRLIGLLDMLSQSSDFEMLSQPNLSNAPTIEFSKRIELIQRYVDANHKRKIKLRDVASLLDMSEQAFSRFFSKTMGKPFFQFLNEYRINTASRMLLETPLSINEIGYKCGYDTLPFFYRQFKKLKGQTPLSFRKSRSQ